MQGALPYALGVAISPIPIAMVLLILSSRGGCPIAMFFSGGWTLGVAMITLAVTLVVDRLDVTDSRPAWIGVLEIVLGVACVAVASRLWRRRKERGPSPAWLTAVDGLTPARSTTLGIVVSGANPKVVALSLGAALSLAQTGADASATASTTALFVAIGAVGVALPVLASLVIPTRGAEHFARLHTWLERHGGAVLIVLALAIGGLFLRDGLDYLA